MADDNKQTAPPDLVRQASRPAFALDDLKHVRFDRLCAARMSLTEFCLFSFCDVARYR